MTVFYIKKKKGDFVFGREGARIFCNFLNFHLKFLIISLSEDSDLALQM